MLSWATRTITYHIRAKIVYGGTILRSTRYNHTTSSDISTNKVTMEQENEEEELAALFNIIHLPSDFSDPASLYRELAMQLKSILPKKFSSLVKLTRAMYAWSQLWSQRNVVGCKYGLCPPKILPVASRSSMAPSSTNATCAIFTVVYNEPVWLPIWIRYYSRHADLRDMWILDHNTNDGSTNSSRLPRGIRYRRLYGEKRFSPHHFLNRQVELHQQRLFRAGYRCVLFTEVDEFIAPNPSPYPGGLREYMEIFLRRNSTARRVTAYHISENNDTTLGPVESALNWSMPLLSQRMVWHRDAAFDKPLLTKIPLQYRPGFHKVENEHLIPGGIPRDPELLFLHMHFADVNYCLNRELKKYYQARNMIEEEKKEGMSAHWWKRKPTELDCRHTRNPKGHTMHPKWHNVII